MTQSRGKKTLWSSTCGSAVPGICRLSWETSTQSSRGRFMWSLNDYPCAPVKDQEFWRNSTIDKSWLTCFSLAEGNSTGSIFWREHVAALNLMGFPALHAKADQTFLAMRRKQIFFLQGSGRLLQAITLLQFNSLLAEPHEATMHVPSQMCLPG